MARPLTILFQHHRTDDVTRGRLEILAKLNPDVPIVLLTHGSTDVLPGTFDSATIPEFANEDGWANADLTIYSWFQCRRTEHTTAERYVFIEYDMLYRVPMTEFYREVWDADFAGAQIFFGGPHSCWNWFPLSVPHLPGSLKPFAAGVSPLAGVFLSHRTLAEIAKGPIPLGVFSECRCATLANSHGFDLVEFPYAKKRNITWKQEFVRMDKDTQVYHPLKQLTSLDHESAEPGNCYVSRTADHRHNTHETVVHTSRCDFTTFAQVDMEKEHMLLSTTANRSGFDEWDRVAGWLTLPQAVALQQVTKRLCEGSTFVELGSFQGRSAIAIASVLPPNCLLYCVDTFRGSEEHGRQRIDCATLLGCFSRNIAAFGVQERVRTLVMSTTEAASLFPRNSVDFLFVDAAHDFQSVSADLRNWYPKLRSGGHLLCHDFVPGWPGVVRAIEDSGLTGELAAPALWLHRKPG